MMTYLVALAIGVFLIGIGIQNRKGNISTLHSYHRKRVKEEDKLPFGKIVGTGTIIAGIGIVIASILSIISVYTNNEALLNVGTIIIVISLVIGLSISFYAMMKYNKGIF